MCPNPLCRGLGSNLMTKRVNLLANSLLKEAPPHFLRPIWTGHRLVRHIQSGSGVPNLRLPLAFLYPFAENSIFKGCLKRNHYFCCLQVTSKLTENRFEHSNVAFLCVQTETTTEQLCRDAETLPGRCSGALGEASPLTALQPLRLVNGNFCWQSQLP